MAAERTIYVLPMDNIEAPVLGAIAETLGRTFDRNVVVADGMALPITAYNADRQQYLALMLIEDIARMDFDGLVLGVANEDFYAEGLNFIFGEADRPLGVAVISLARLRMEYYGGKPDGALLVERAVKEAVHEIGHLVGLPHCKNEHCVMRYSINIKHTDRKSPQICALCRHTFRSHLRA